MARGSGNATSDKDTPGEAATHKAIPVCGVIMPISATSSFGEAHWARVQILVHRAIKAAGFSPANVWENSTKDRISERIIGNIFRHEVAVADISDLNPNVMLELGLRLSSKKPTIVIACRGNSIPFDIRDFEIVFYPPDLNIIDMEEFFLNLENSISSKYKAFSDSQYTPFLGDIFVDIISPKERETSIDNIILSRLDDIERRISTPSTISRFTNNIYESKSQKNLNNSTATYAFIDNENLDNFIDGLEQQYSSWKLSKIASDGNGNYYEIKTSKLNSDGSPLDPNNMHLFTIIDRVGGTTGIPNNLFDKYRKSGS